MSDAPAKAALLDVRAEHDFVLGHAADAANIPLESLAISSHELPARTALIRITDSDPARAETAREILSRRGNPVEVVPLASLNLSTTGPASVRLWSPNPFLVEAFAELPLARYSQFSLPRYAGGGGVPVAGEIRRALDVACGTGRDAVWLALQGLKVDAIDHLPDALERAASLAHRNGVSVNAIQKDIEADPTLPDGYDLVCVFRYLHRSLWLALRNAIKPGGFIVYETFHMRTREAGGRPSSPDYLLQTGELTAAFEGFEILISRDATERDGRYFSSLLARKKPV